MKQHHMYGRYIFLYTNAGIVLQDHSNQSKRFQTSFSIFVTETVITATALSFTYLFISQSPLQSDPLVSVWLVLQTSLMTYKMWPWHALLMTLTRPLTSRGTFLARPWTPPLRPARAPSNEKYWVTQERLYVWLWIPKFQSWRRQVHTHFRLRVSAASYLLHLFVSGVCTKSY